MKGKLLTAEYGDLVPPLRRLLLPGLSKAARQPAPPAPAAAPIAYRRHQHLQLVPAGAYSYRNYASCCARRAAPPRVLRQSETSESSAMALGSEKSPYC